MTAETRVLRTEAGGWCYSDSVYLQRWMARLLKKSTVTVGGCWIWNGWASWKGYGQTAWRGDNVAIHRKIYEVMHGIVLATEQFVCHTCDQRCCWNPAHLFLGSAKVNNNDCAAKGRHHNAVKTHCKFGHEFTPENTYFKVTLTTTMRACLACQKIRMQTPRYKAKARENQRRRRSKNRPAVTEAA